MTSRTEMANEIVGGVEAVAVFLIAVAFAAIGDRVPTSDCECDDCLRLDGLALVMSRRLGICPR